MRTVTLGSGSASVGDRIEPALALAADGRAQYLVFDRLGELTLAMAQRAYLEDPSQGYDPQLIEVVDRFAPFIAGGRPRLIGNFGAANLDGALTATIDTLRARNVGGVRIALVRGDDVRDLLLKTDAELTQLGTTAGALEPKIVSAHAYIGAEPIIEALQQDAALVMGGRICDASMAVAAVCHELQKPVYDWDVVATATLVGHLLTGGSGLTGGGFADPPYRTVAGLHNLGFGLATVDSAGFELSKLADAGGEIRPDIVKSRIAYEVHDPAAYLTPDVAADFSNVGVELLEKDRVRVDGIVGRARPENYRVLVGVDAGWRGVGEISFGGPGCLDRARLGEEIARKRLATLGADVLEIKADMYGYDALFAGAYRPQGEPAEIRLRIATLCATREAAAAAAGIVGYLYWGPAGGGASSAKVERAIGVTEAFVPRAQVNLEVEVTTL